MNDVYLSASLDIFDVDFVPQDVYVNFDLNKDALVQNAFWFDLAQNLEYAAIKTGIEKHLLKVGDNFDYYAVLIDNLNKLDLLGKGGLGQSKPEFYRFILICPDHHKSSNVNPTLNNTITHELGHAAFNLQHPFLGHDPTEVSSGYTQGTDKDNFMDYYDGNTSRKYQWFIIKDNIKPKRK